MYWAVSNTGGINYFGEIKKGPVRGRSGIQDWKFQILLKVPSLQFNFQNPVAGQLTTNGDGASELCKNQRNLVKRFCTIPNFIKSPFSTVQNPVPGQPTTNGSGASESL